MYPVYAKTKSGQDEWIGFMVEEEELICLVNAYCAREWMMKSMYLRTRNEDEIGEWKFECDYMPLHQQDMDEDSATYAERGYDVEFRDEPMHWNSGPTEKNMRQVLCEMDLHKALTLTRLQNSNTIFIYAINPHSPTAPTELHTFHEKLSFIKSNAK